MLYAEQIVFEVAQLTMYLYERVGIANKISARGAWKELPAWSTMGPHQTTVMGRWLSYAKQCCVVQQYLRQGNCSHCYSNKRTPSGISLAARRTTSREVSTSYHRRCYQG